MLDNQLFDQIKHYRNKIYLNVIMPTDFCGGHRIDQDDKFDQVWTICPYSVDWLNKIKNTNKYKLTNYPFNAEDIPSNTDKLYDVCYHGGLHGEKWVRMLEVMSAFNYSYMTMTHGINRLTQANLSAATDLNLTHWEKLERISQCKISICFNNTSISSLHVSRIKSLPSYEENTAFNFIDHKIIPQIKSRINEAAFCRTLNLVERDPWNVIEYWYEPGVDFVYFDNLIDLYHKIIHILNNWSDYVSQSRSENKNLLIIFLYYSFIKCLA